MKRTNDPRILRSKRDYSGLSYLLLIGAVLYSTALAAALIVWFV